MTVINFSNLNPFRFDFLFFFLEFLLRDKIMSGKVLIEWRYPYCQEISKKRYLNSNSIRELHMNISNIFFPPDTEDNDNVEHENLEERQLIEGNEDKKSVQSQHYREKERDNSSLDRKSSSAAHANDDNSTFYNPMAADVSYSMRHVEESWHHLMHAGDLNKFKQIAVCNFDFLLAAVRIL